MSNSTHDKEGINKESMSKESMSKEIKNKEKEEMEKVEPSGGSSSLPILAEERIPLSSLLSNSHKIKPKTKEEFFNFLGVPLGDYKMDLDVATAQSLRAHLAHLKTGLHSRVPMTCPGGVKCPVGRKCDFTKFLTDKRGEQILDKDNRPIIDEKNSKWPLFQSCPYETSIIAMRVVDLCTEYKVDPTDPASVTDMTIISKIAELDIYDARASTVLAGESIILDEITGFEIGNENREIVSKRLHPAFELKEKIHKMRQELIKSMVGDRISKVKAQSMLGKGDGISTLTDIMTKIRQKLDNKEEIIDVEVIEIDDDLDRK